MELPGPEFRPAGVGDVLTLVHFNQAMAKETEDLELSEGTLQEGVKAVLQDPTKGQYFVLELEHHGVIAALLITYEWSDWRNSQLWWIQSVYVHPEHRRRGYFKLLYRHVRHLAQQQGIGGLRLYADMSNTRAHGTYEALGMTSHYKVFEDMFS